MASKAAESAAQVTSKGKSWARVSFVVVLFVVLIQISLFVANRILAKPAGPRAAVMTDVTAIAIAEIVTVLAVHRLLRRGNRTLGDLGLWRGATSWAWICAIALGFLTAMWGLSNPVLHLRSKATALLDPSLWHLYTGLLAGLAAGFCEEIIFRGFVIQELASAGHAAWVQVSGSAFLFGVAHAGLLRAGWMNAALVIVPTAMLGALYALIYLLGKRSLLPVIASHFLNDFAVIPWVFLAVASMRR
jgi:membrane protease YdiL (CAAX protease family)